MFLAVIHLFYIVECVPDDKTERTLPVYTKWYMRRAKSIIPEYKTDGLISQNGTFNLYKHEFLFFIVASSEAFFYFYYLKNMVV
jgi:hypothetical protein